jgi:hypothetical protein
MDTNDNVLLHEVREFALLDHPCCGAVSKPLNTTAMSLVNLLMGASNYKLGWR